MTAALLPFLRKFWPFILAAGLVMVILFQRGDLAMSEAKREAAEQREANLRAVNDQNVKTIEGLTEQRIANEAIVRALIDSKADNANRETTVRVAIEKEARNNEAVRNWLDLPIPAGVRAILNSQTGD